jgi:hypothetical protein
MLGLPICLLHAWLSSEKCYALSNAIGSSRAISGRLTDCISGTTEKMSRAADRELTLLLARAFDWAWNRYYATNRRGACSAEIVRPILAEKLVALAKEGVRDEEALARRGLAHLASLAPENSWAQIQIRGASARFTRLWRVRFGSDLTQHQGDTHDVFLLPHGDEAKRP